MLACSVLSVALYAALMLDYTYLGWWLGHAFELVGIAVIGASTAYDLRRGRGSQTLSGTLRDAAALSEIAGPVIPGGRSGP